jgi:multidrug efflux pump subunit AcrB
MNRFNLSALAVRERAVTFFLILAVAGAGGYAFVHLGRAEDPSFTIKILTVTDAWPGATAQEMQELVADPLEKRLQELRWYDHVDTFTRPGLAFMTVVLKDNTPPEAVQEEFYQARKKNWRPSAFAAGRRASSRRQRRIFRHHLRALCVGSARSATTSPGS